MKFKYCMWKLFQNIERGIAIPILGLLIMLIFIILIINKWEKLNEFTRKSFMLQIYGGLIFVILSIIKYLQWFFINSRLTDRILGWVMWFYVGIFFLLLIYGFITKKYTFFDKILAKISKSI